MQNAVNKNKMLMLCLIVFLVILMAVAILITSATGAVASADSSATSVYKQAVGSYETDLNYVQDDRITEFDSKGANWLFSFSSDYSSFEYIVELGSSNEVLYSSFLLRRGSDFSDCLGFGIGGFDNDFGLNCIVRVMLGDYDSHPSKPYYEKDFFISDSLDNGDSLYFTLNSERAFFSWFSQYESPSRGKSEYDMSLDHIFLSFDVGSDWYKRLTSIVFNETETPTICVETRTSDNSVVYPGESPVGRCYYKEQITFYKNIEAPVKEGYRFTGWYYDEACTIPYKGETITSDVKLYAGFEKLKYNVFFESCYVDPTNPNTSGLYDYSAEVEYGDVAEYPLELPDGVHLSGWYFADGSKYDNTPVTSDMHLYGRYYCTITFELPNVDEIIDPIEVEVGSYIKLPVPTISPDRYGFSYWECPDNPSWTEEQPIMSDMHFVSLWYKNIFTVTFYVDGEIFKQIDVAYGSSLGGATTDAGIDTATVIGFENVNYVTSAVAFNEFEVCDDVLVFLSETSDVIEDNKDSGSSGVAGSIKEKFDNFGNNVKSFFVKIGQFFKNYWQIIVGAIGAVIVICVVIAVLLKFRR
ncbi:MAG: InlB B-repeat-containing protein [Clostridia bacterium]|nr:InlB B-repeat-containing protein [Clostridia bacterium]